MFLTKQAKGSIILFTILFTLLYVFPADVPARVGGGRSFGSRGSRSYTSPSPSRTSPAQPSPGSGSMSQPSPQPQGSFLRSLAGGVAGGLIGGMLFRSLGFGGPGAMGDGGIGLFDMVLIGALLYGIYWYIKKKRQGAELTPYYRQATTGQPANPSVPYVPVNQQHEIVSDVETGISHIRQMDPSFNEQKFQDFCMDQFFEIQGAWANRDMSSVKNLLTDEMYIILQGDAERLKVEKRINKLENIAVRSVDIMEAWQEKGMDFITVKFYANLLDYTVDETTGQIASGSKIDPVKFEEYWTFTRQVANNAWQVSAINQPE